MSMPGRKYTAPSSSYRYGFNSQERSTEINDNSYTALFWEYDARIGRRWNIDPVIQPSESGYACFNNNPILITDLNGDNPKDPYKVKKGDNLTTIAKNNGTTVDKLLE
jgi:LysM repeat protein